MPLQNTVTFYRKKWSIFLNLLQVQNVATFSVKVYSQMVATFPSQMVVTFPSYLVETFSRFLFGPFKVILLYDMMVTYDMTKFYPKFHKHYILKVKINLGSWYLIISWSECTLLLTCWIWFDTIMMIASNHIKRVSNKVHLDQLMIKFHEPK